MRAPTLSVRQSLTWFNKTMLGWLENLFISALDNLARALRALSQFGGDDPDGGLLDPADEFIDDYDDDPEAYQAEFGPRPDALAAVDGALASGNRVVVKLGDIEVGGAERKSGKGP